MSEIEVQGLVKRFGTNTVVDNVSFHLKDGEFLALLGPSGGGKSTILRIICGLEEPDAGRILLNGQDITKFPPRQRNLGMVFQDYGLYPTMSVYGNIAYGLETRNVPKLEIQKRVAEAAEKLSISSLLNRSINELSGGEQQRIALARIMVKDAEAFLYDEPLSNLDPKLRYKARQDILKVHNLKKKPSIYVTHDQNEAFAIADRIAVIAQGKLQQIGTTEELLEEPANLFMARFVGSPPMNLIEGQIALNGQEYSVNIDDLTLPLNSQWTPQLQAYDRTDIIVGIRPHTVIPEWELGNQENSIQPIDALVEDVEALIGEIIVTLKLSNHTIITAVWSETDNFPNAGDNIRIGIDPTTFSLFDPSSEQALKTSSK